MSKKVNEIIVDAFLNCLKENTIPWQKPWKSSEGFFNFLSKKQYRGVNVISLCVLGNDCKYFMTFNQIKEKGGTLKKGSKGIPIVFYSPIEKEDGTKFFMLKYYSVFRSYDIEGIDFPQDDTKQIDFNAIEDCEKLTSKLSIPVNYGGGRACYIPSKDEINMPNKESFNSNEAFYATMFHEIGHSLASKVSKVKLDTNFGSDKYSKEELVAEIFSSFCLNHCNILSEKCFDNSKAYAQSWAEKIKKDPSVVINAASEAQKRFDYFISLQ